MRAKPAFRPSLVYPVGFLLMLLMAVVFPPSHAEESQTAPLPEESSPLKIKEKELLAVRRDIVRDTLKLEDEIARQFWPLYDEYQEQLSELRAKRRELLTDLGQGVDGMSEEEAKEYVKDKLEYEEIRLNLGRAYFRKLSRFMNYRTLALYVQVETKIRVYIEAGIEESIPLIR